MVRAAFTFVFLLTLAVSGAAATITAKIDTDEHPTSPVPHRYIHGVIPDDAKFQLALPDNWNGKLVVFSRGFSGTELTTGSFKTTALEKGEAAGYLKLVEHRVGRQNAGKVLAVYYIPGMGHGGAEYNSLLGEPLDALERWIDYRESGGKRGTPAPDSLGGYPRIRE